LRMSVREPSRFFDGLQDNWFHFSCFWKRIKPGKVTINERSIRGMDLIKWDDQVNLLRLRLSKQADLMWDLRKGFKENLKKPEMVELLTSNNLNPPSGESKVSCLFLVAIYTARGLMEWFSTSQRTYICTGQLSEYTKCTYRNGNPDRSKFAVPKELKENPYLKKLKVNVSEGDADGRSVGGSSGLLENILRIFSIVLFKFSGPKSGLSRHLVKAGTVVDQECEYCEVSHVHRAKNGRCELIAGSLYAVVLGSVDMAINKNSYYKIQLLKHDTKPTFYLFRSWGRVGTAIGGTRTEVFRLEEDAIDAFEQLFLEKSGNRWKNKSSFKKLPGYMDLVETDFTELVLAQNNAIVPGSKTKLPPPIKDILLMIFDMEQLKSTMMSFQLDLDKMPLGKLSKRQITSAFSVLSELQAKEHPDKILDATNRFYTLIPHNFGFDKPPLLNSREIIKEKCDMLGSLLEIQIAYELVKEEEDETCLRDPVDVHYERLMCKMEVSAVCFERIQLYMANTHGETHTTFNLEIVDVTLNRVGEDVKFKANIGNRRLLWHGSGTANYGGILSQGLRIAPPEAPVTGYMFGKGVYFADMASKSANYCRVYADNTDGLLLLCDVALGKVKQELHAVDHSPKTLKGYNSVQGVGGMEPDPTKVTECDEGYTIRLEKPVKAADSETRSLLYNECVSFVPYLFQTRRILKCELSYGCLWFLSEMSIL
uniref:Poly [ADP-ribose] polymerase n=1 Tax=Heligmosomoides polygyrus TaxID=6339 RepID=A0A183FRW2_HELPZ